MGASYHGVLARDCVLNHLGRTLNWAALGRIPVAAPPRLLPLSRILGKKKENRCNYLTWITILIKIKFQELMIVNS